MDSVRTSQQPQHCLCFVSYSNQHIDRITDIYKNKFDYNCSEGLRPVPHEEPRSEREGDRQGGHFRSTLWTLYAYVIYHGYDSYKAMPDCT